MEYKIEITRMIDNPDYGQQMEDWKDSGRSYRSDRLDSPPSKRIPEKIFLASLTEAEMESIKKAWIDTL
jgi:hypothetical protein